MYEAIILILLALASASGRVLEIECNSANATQDGPYDVLSTEYHGWIKLNDPFYVEQTINIHAVYNTTHNMTYTQICETNDKDFQTPGFIDPFKLHEIHRKVVTKISGFLYSNEENKDDETKGGQPDVFEEEDESPNQTFDFIPMPPPTTSPRPQRSLNAAITVRNIHKMKRTYPELRRDLALVDDDEVVPEAYIPPRRKSYIRYVYNRLISLAKSKHPVKTTIKEEKKEILRARIFKLERQRDQVALLFTIQVLYSVKNPSSYCQKIKSVRAAIKCFAHHYDELMDSPDYSTAAHYFHELINLEAKVASESKLFYTYLDSHIPLTT